MTVKIRIKIFLPKVLLLGFGLKEVKVILSHFHG